jgi:hypothetical protein
MRCLFVAAALLVVPACHGHGATPDGGDDVISNDGGDDVAIDGSIVDSGPPDVPVGPLPDMAPMADMMDGTWFVSYYPDVTPDSPVYVEGCVSGLGTRKVIRFDTVTGNLGDADFYVGVPSADNPLFQWSPAHMHYHVLGYADYQLLGTGLPDGVTGHKQAFCLVDSTQLDPNAVAHYTCDDQGITAGYADTYGYGLDCQWIDITDVPSGTYTLQVEINPERRFLESDYSNNIYQTPVTF